MDADGGADVAMSSGSKRGAEDGTGSGADSGTGGGAGGGQQEKRPRLVASVSTTDATDSHSGSAASGASHASVWTRGTTVEVVLAHLKRTEDYESWTEEEVKTWVETLRKQKAGTVGAVMDASDATRRDWKSDGVPMVVSDAIRAAFERQQEALSGSRKEGQFAVTVICFALSWGLHGYSSCRPCVLWRLCGAGVQRSALVGESGVYLPRVSCVARL